MKVIITGGAGFVGSRLAKELLHRGHLIGLNGYTQAKPGSFHLVPKDERLPELQRDYQLMRDMYLNDPLSFDNILSILTNLEHRINHVKSLHSLE